MLDRKEIEPRFAIYTMASLIRDVPTHGHVYRRGTQGRIVEVHGDHEAYEVEFSKPFRVVTLRAADLKPLQ